MHTFTDFEIGKTIIPRVNFGFGCTLQWLLVRVSLEPLTLGKLYAYRGTRVNRVLRVFMRLVKVRKSTER